MSGRDALEAGWYPDPSGAVRERFWDGHSWSSETRDYSAPSAFTSLAGPPQNALSRSRKKPLVLAALATTVILLVLAVVWGFLGQKPVPTRFATVNDLATTLEQRGIECPGTDSMFPHQRLCSPDFALTVWATPSKAMTQARTNSSLLGEFEIGNSGFIVVLNGLISPPDDRVDEVMRALKDFEPVLVK